MSEQTMYKTNNHESRFQKLPTWATVLLILGSPLWLSLLISAFAVVLSLYVSLWAAIVSLWAVFASFAAYSLGGILSGIVFCLSGHIATAITMFAASLICAGLSIFLFFGCKAATGGTVLLTKKLFKCFRKGKAV